MLANTEKQQDAYINIYKAVIGMIQKWNISSMNAVAP